MLYLRKPKLGVLQETKTKKSTHQNLGSIFKKKKTSSRVETYLVAKKKE